MYVLPEVYGSVKHPTPSHRDFTDSTPCSS